MDEITTAVQDAPQSTGLPSRGKAESTSKTTPKTYTEEEVINKVSDSLAEQGRKHKETLDSVTKERDTFKSQAEQAQKKADEATSTVTERQERIAELEADMETAMEGNPDAAEVAKIKKDLRTQKDKLLAEVKAEKEANAELKKTLDKEREEWAGTVNEAKALKFEVDIFEVAEDFEGGDADRLKALCEKAGKLKRSEIEDLAGVLWTKKMAAKKAEEPEVETDSGVTKGGGGFNFKTASAKEKLAEAMRRDAKKPLKIGGK